MTGLSIPWRGARHSSTWPAATCIRYISYRAAMVISHFIQHGGRRQESWEVLHAAEIVEHIRAVMPHRIVQSPTHLSLAPILLLSAIEELQCPICFGVLQQPIQLLCDRFVCATCLIEWVHLAAAHFHAVTRLCLWNVHTLSLPLKWCDFYCTM